MISKRIENIAQEILDQSNSNNFPIDIEKIVKSFGIEIITDNLGDDVSGLLAIEGDKIIIGVDKNQNNNLKRKRFTIAHEFGHFMLHRNHQSIFIDSNFKVMFRDNNSTRGVDINEIQANAFAAAILMPKRLLIERISTLNLDLSDDSSIEKIAKDFGVSMTAMSYRISNLGLV